LRYLARYTHRVAISNRRLLSLDDNGDLFNQVALGAGGHLIGEPFNIGGLH